MTHSNTSGEGLSKKDQKSKRRDEKAELKAKKKSLHRDLKKKKKDNKEAKKDSDRNAKRDSSDEDRPAKKPKVDRQDDSPSSSATAPAATSEEAQAYYKEHDIHVDAEDDTAFPPCLSFAQAPFPTSLMKVCGNFKAPSPIQAACWPVIHARRDIIGIAQTGSGKTIAFGIPGIAHIQARTKANQQSRGPVMLVLTPTRELALQIEEQFKGILSPAQSTNVLCVYGGEKRWQQIEMAKKNRPQILVATPGRLLDLIHDEHLDLTDVSYLVLDEADRMLDNGFEQPIREIIRMIKTPARQTVMFSATWPESVRKLASDFLRDPVRVTVGSEDLTVNKNVTQVVEVLDPQGKSRRLLELLNKYHKMRTNRVLIFVLYKNEATWLEKFLGDKGWNVGSIHGNKAQNQRQKALNKFTDGSCPLLVATDVAARGLDIPMVEYVINYTFPLRIDDYIHRIGRTGRGGQTGTAHTFFTAEERSHSGELINVLKAAGVPIQPELLKFGTTVKRKEHGAYGNFYKEIDHKAKATKIIFD
ncbi:P-loop containing nucleoside triphosphate hydrolase protein [Dimargaris cristalligena]|uniref:RNA helicase n=1 Tax=Dimargaris cristalligena TaxID=215637 RepID=A0A4P9ZRB9_9FUNG|nr:P-loop containing nucleoside triphosphate hydrolase protein [Dimargaris cristalligena]|eukprot:RKP34980.1 P-loop containing nucleoside triphosphate hydrolase protein [Dimargaris cristalligena]